MRKQKHIGTRITEDLKKGEKLDGYPEIEFIANLETVNRLRESSFSKHTTYTYDHFMFCFSWAQFSKQELSIFARTYHPNLISDMQTA